MDGITKVCAFGAMASIAMLTVSPALSGIIAIIVIVLAILVMT